MLRFTVLGFPVSVVWTFWVGAALLGSGRSNTREGFQIMLVFIVAAFVSILLHELGHAWHQRKYGGRSQIVMHAFGGYAEGSGRYTRNQSLIITFAGPAMNFLLAALAYLVARAVHLDLFSPYRPYGMSFLAATFIKIMFHINLFWGLLNLVPVLPLDGGRILEHAMYGRNPALRFRVSAIAAALVAVAGLVLFKQFFLAAMFGYLAYVNWEASQGRHVRNVFTGQ